MNIIASYYRALADATDVELQAAAIQLSAMKRRRDAFRELEKFFTPPPTAPLDTPLPPIVPPPFDPDYDEPPAEQEPGPAQQQDEAAP